MTTTRPSRIGLAHAACVLFRAALLAVALSAPAAAEDASPLRYPRDRAVDVERLALDLDIDLEGARISGRATIAGRTIADAVAEVALDAMDLRVKAVTGADGKPLTFRDTGAQLVVTFDPPLAPRGARFSISVEYEARPAPERGGLWFFGPTTDEPETPLQLWTQGESEESRLWFPCVDTPEERQQLEVRARVPLGYECLSNGALVERTDDAASGRTRFLWRQQVAVPAYLVTLVVGKFHVERDEWRGIPVTYYVPPGRKADARRSFSETPRMLELFSTKIGVAYPFEKYAQVCVEQFVHGGMENSSATTLMEATLHDARAHLDYSSDGLVAHELAHQWWGDLLTCRDWKDIWLNEGFASYFEAVWEEEARGPDEYAYEMIDKAGGALGGGRDTPLVRRRYESPDDTFGGGTYPKGAWVLHMLRREVGDERFWASIRRYAETHQAAAVESDDLRRAFEKETGRSLGWFFDQWLERPGHPVLEVSAAWDDGEKLLEVSIEQKQPHDPFRFTAEIDLGAALPDGVTRTVKIPVAKRAEKVYIPLVVRPAWISFDPRQRVLRETTLHFDRDQLEAALERDPSITGRIEAARALAAQHGAGAVPALAKRLAADAYSGVRAQVAGILAGIPGDESRDALLAGLPANRPEKGTGTRHDARVRDAIVGALGGFRGDEAVGKVLAGICAAGDPSYAVEAGAARALGRLDIPGAALAIRPLLARDSHEEGLRRAAIDALSQLRDAAPGLAAAKEWSAKGRPRRVRIEAIGALGRLAARKDIPEAERTAVAATLTAVLDERSPRVRRAAIDALRGLGAEGALPALEALAARDPRESVREQAKAAAAAIRGGRPADAEMARFREDLEKLRAENAKLEDRLHKVEAKGASPSAPTPPRTDGF